MIQALLRREPLYILALEACADGGEGFFGLRTWTSYRHVIDVRGEGHSQPLMSEQAWVIYALGVRSSVLALRLDKPPIEGVLPALSAAGRPVNDAHLPKESAGAGDGVWREKIGLKKGS